MTREQKREIAGQLTRWWMRLERLEKESDAGINLTGRECVELQNFLQYLRAALNIPRG